MSEATFAVGNFLGGEISKFAQGRFDKPDYRTSLKVCVNSFPAEIGPWTRRPGSRHAGTTRTGGPGRTIKFDFDQANAVTAEFTDNIVRFRSGVTLLDANDSVGVIGASAANPCVIQVNAPTTWATGNTVYFSNGDFAPLVENRQFLITVIDPTHFSIADAITGTPIDGATLGPISGGPTVKRIQELVTAYPSGTWSGIRAVQAETTDILLCGSVAPQALTVPNLPVAGVNPIFAIAPAAFNDGPYLDPFVNGVQATPTAKTGIITLTLAFPAYDSTKAYAAGAFVTSAGINYISLQDQNVSNTPAGAPTFWATTSANAAINNGRGFLGSDIGRLVRLLSEPPLWLVATAYATPGTVVAYNPSGIPGATTYWQNLTANTGKAPGADLTNWQIVPQGAAVWTWGKITSLSNIIDRALAGSVNIGNMTNGGGIAAAFDGVFTKHAVACAQQNISTVSVTPPGTVLTQNCYVGKNYAAASDQKVMSGTVYPSDDEGFFRGFYHSPLGTFQFIPTLTFNLRGKATLPTFSGDGTLLGTSGPIGNTLAPVTVLSNDQVTAWKYVWMELISVVQVGGGTFNADSYNLSSSIGQLSLFNPSGTGTAAGCNLEILGPALLYTSAILTWRLGVYSNTTGWPTCGIYNDGRLYLGGAVGNRFDACVSNGILGAAVNFAPTDQYGVVSAASAISYTFNSNGVNPILWMDSDLQGIKMGTQAGEWLVVAPTAGSIAPNNISARNVTGHGSTNVQPCRTEHTTIFVQRFSRKLLEYFPDVYSGKFSAPNLADKAEHIVRSGISELAYTGSVTPIVWGRCGDGSLFGITYKRDSLASAQPPTFYGWHRHPLGSGRTIESVCTGPSVGGTLDSLTMVTNDAATNIRHVEVLTDAMDELTALADAWFLDDAVTPTSTIDSGTGLTLNGLWHLNGKTVQVFAGGLDCGDPGEGKPLVDFLVTNGSCTVPYGDGISAGSGRGLFTQAFAAALPLSQIVVGFTYDSDGQMVKPILPADSGARNGPALGKLTRAHRYAMMVVNTLGLSIGGTFAKLRPAKYETTPAALTTFTGIAQDGANDDDGYDNGWCWRVSRPFPANVIAVALNLNTKDQ